MFRIALALALLPAVATAEEIHDCTVTDFLSSDRTEPGFAELNLQKRFVLTVDGSRIGVTFPGRNGQQIAQDYTVVAQDDMTTFAVRPLTMNLDSLVMPADHRRRGPGFSATITLQGEFYVNAWILACTTR